MNPKKLAKSFLCRLLEAQVKQLRNRSSFKLIAVAGSAGKTSTKLAIAKTLAINQRVIYQSGNYNDRLTVPLILFGHANPGIYNLAAWARILLKNRQQLKKDYPYDLAVVELGPDGPDQIKYFAYLKPDIVVLTAIADEHMEQFKTLDAVAHEELIPLSFSKQALINIDDIPTEYLPKSSYKSYGLNKPADYKVTDCQPRALQSQKMTFSLPGERQITAEVAALGGQGAKIAAAAVAVGDILGISTDNIQNSLRAITHVPGRMQILAGKQGSIIIDDTYNASPIAVNAALDVLYGAEAQQRIAILGSMNELGADSSKLHQAVGAHCDPTKLDLVVTIGKEANDYLAPAAKAKGCIVKSFTSPYQAGEYVAGQVKPGSIILAKGSQNGVFAEEAVKVLLASPDQARKLVRQSDYWLNIKKHQFRNT